MDIVTYEKLCNEAMSGMEFLLEDVKTPLKNFNKKKYPDCFQNLMRKNENVLQCAEAVYKEAESKEEVLYKLSKNFVLKSKEKLASCKWKFQKEQLLADWNIFLVVYLIPMILAFRGSMSEAFAEEILEQWNAAFQTNLKAGSYDQINQSFRTGIFGISFGENK